MSELANNKAALIIVALAFVAAIYWYKTRPEHFMIMPSIASNELSRPFADESTEPVEQDASATFAPDVPLVPSLDQNSAIMPFADPTHPEQIFLANGSIAPSL